jgi:formate hydrogenlyase subunit 6/NADH:ubiquinone oxidoreductase subunit I
MPYKITDACNGCSACERICPVDAIHGEKKKRYYIDGDICIECGACGKVCPTGAIVDQNNRPCEKVKRSEWEKPQFNTELCASCNICIETCPVGCIELSDATGKDMHGYPFLAAEKACIGCGFCAADCPVDAITMS